MKSKIIKAGFFLVLLFFVSVRAFPEETKKLTWEDCVSSAEKSNPDIKSALEKISQKEADIGISRAAFLPTVDATAGYKRTYTSGGSSNSGNGSVYSYGITGKQLIFDGFKSYYELKGAGSRADEVRYDYMSTSAKVRLDLRAAYINLLKAQEKRVLAAEIEKRRKHIMELVKMRYESGSEHIGSYTSAKADYARARSDVDSAERGIVYSREKLLSLMGSSEKGGISAADQLSVTEMQEKYTSEPDYENLTASHPSVLKAKSALEAARYDVDAADMDYSPKVYATAAAQKTGSSAPPKTTDLSVGLEVTANIFAGGSTYYTVKKATSAYRQSLSDEASAKSTVYTSLKEKWNSLRDAISDVDVQKQYLSAAVERSKIGEAQYSIGTLTFDNWTIIEDNLVNTKKSYLDACATVLQSEAEWIQSTGRALEYENKK